MRHIFTGVCALASALICFSGCEEDRVTYSGPDYVMFSDSITMLAVQNDDYHEISIATMQATDHDRTFGVEVVSKESNAIDGKHYSLESNSVLIKAGERAGTLRVRSFFNNFEDTDSIGITLRLVNQEKVWDVYGDKARVLFQKICPFDVNTFTGYCLIRSAYYQSYMPGVEYRLIRTVADPDDANGIIMKNYWYNGYDLKVKLSTKDPLEPLLSMDEQMLATTGEAFFGNIWGDNILHIKFAPGYASYFNVCQHFMIQYVTLTVENVGTVGTYVNAIEWVSKAEAKRMLQERSTSNGLPEDDELNQRK